MSVIPRSKLFAVAMFLLFTASVFGQFDTAEVLGTIRDSSGNLRGSDDVGHWFDLNAFAIPPASAPFGNLGRNSSRGPSLWQWDLGINKNFRLPFRAGMALQFRPDQTVVSGPADPVRVEAAVVGA